MIFQPTFLYIKQHIITGKLYFGKTTGAIEYLLNEYDGSGTYWMDHLRVHGSDVVTLWYELFTDQEECVKFALEFSEKMNIVKSKHWANLIPENGLGGHWSDTARAAAAISPNRISLNPEHQKKFRRGGSIAVIDSPNANWKDPEHFKKMVTASGSSPNRISLNLEHQRQAGKKAVASQHHNSKRKVKCPHCNKEGVQLIMSRYHFDRCKNRGTQN